jgi:predicted ATP-grasp superfamily ATP-dependent carboligase
MRVVVTDGNNRAALAVTRSLGRLGHHVVVGERRSPALAQTSRFCAARFTYPDPVSQPDAFADRLLGAVREHRADALIPMADVTTFSVLRRRAEFEAVCALPLAPTAAIDRAADKAATLETARELGLPVPRTARADGPGTLPALDFPYPVVVKPHRSRVLTPAGWKSTSVSYAADADALARELARRAAHEFPLLIQERIVGPGVGVFACYDRGRPAALFSHRRLRERPPWGGVSVLSESAPLDPQAAASATALLDALGWHGVAMVEFKRDERDGAPRLMEINGRFWGSLQLAVDAGVDFPAMLTTLAEGRAIPPQPPYRLGVRNRWLWGDVDNLILTLQGRGPAGSARPRGRALREFLTFWGRDLHYENPKLGDLKPWAFESYRWCARLVGAQGAGGEG